MIAFLPAILCLCAALPGGHADGEDYVFLSFFEDRIEGRFEIHFDDLREKLGLDVDPSAETATADAQRVAAIVQAYIKSNFSIGSEGGAPWLIEFGEIDTHVLPKGTFAGFEFKIALDGLPDRLAVRHSMFYSGDREHRGLLCVEYNGKTGKTYPGEYTALVFGPDKMEQVLDLVDVPGILEPWDMIEAGLGTLRTRFDHLLFVIVLLLTSVLVRAGGEARGWRPAEGFRSAAVRALVTMVAFGVALSLALILASYDLLSLSDTVLEFAVAGTMVLVVVQNLTGTIRSGWVQLVAALGALHGLRLAVDLAAMPFRMLQHFKIVVGFNIGVALGIAAVVAVAFPILFRMRNSDWYGVGVLRGASIVLGLAALWPLVQLAS